MAGPQTQVALPAGANSALKTRGAGSLPSLHGVPRTEI